MLSILAGVELAILAARFPQAKGHRADDAQPRGGHRQVADRACRGRASTRQTRMRLPGCCSRSARPNGYDEARSTSSPRSPARGRPSSIASSTRCLGRRGAWLARGAGRAAGAGDGRGRSAARRSLTARSGRTRAPRRQPRRDDAGRARRARRATKRSASWSEATLRAARDRSAEMAAGAEIAPAKSRDNLTHSGLSGFA